MNHFLFALVLVFLGRGEVLILIVIFHLVSGVLRLLSRFGEVNVLATSAASTGDDVLSRDRFKVVMVLVVIVCYDNRKTEMLVSTC